MKFTRETRSALRPVTGRRGWPTARSAARRALQRQADEVALFPELQPKETPEQRIARLDAEAAAHHQRMRDHTAATWRLGRLLSPRRALRTLTPAQREQVLARWHAPTWHPPHEAHYLADLIHTVTHSKP